MKFIFLVVAVIVVIVVAGSASYDYFVAGTFCEDERKEFECCTVIIVLFNCHCVLSHYIELFSWCVDVDGARGDQFHFIPNKHKGMKLRHFIGILREGNQLRVEFSK
jgi:uncharacterized membrane protein YciS (DUF1049 family)